MSSAKKPLFIATKPLTKLWLLKGILSVALACAQAANPMPLRGHVPLEVTNLQPVGRLAETNRLHLAIALPLRNQPELTALLEAIYDRKSTNYHRYLTPAQFTEKFGPTERDYETVAQFAKRSGFSVVNKHSNRLLLDVVAPVAAIEKSFHVELCLFKHPTEKRYFYAPNSEPSIDAALPVSEIMGLQNYALPHANGGTGSAPDGSFMGNDFRAAYLPGVTLTGAGQTVAIVTFDGYYPSDVLAYELTNGLPNVPLTNILVDDFDGVPGEDGLGNGGILETSMDIEMAISMAPGLSQVLVYEASNIHIDDISTSTGATVCDLLNRVATDNLANVISCSWHWAAIGVNSATTDVIFQQMAVQGQTFCVASGDNGAYVSGVDEPVSNPYVTAVGGTTLETSGPGGNWLSEVVWNHSSAFQLGISGGGPCTSYAIPPYQQDIDMTTNLGSTVFRNVPDIAMVSDNIRVFYGSGKMISSGGTSAAAPLFAGFVALVNQQAVENGQQPVGFLNPAIYAVGKGPNYFSAFHDIVSGNNSLSPTNKYFAVPGYDLCTGWGTPNGQGLIDALLAQNDSLIVTPAAGFTASGEVGGPFNVTSQTYLLTNTGPASVTWSLINTSIWLSASPMNGTLSPGGNIGIAVELNSMATTLPGGTYDANVWFTNETTGLAQPRSFTLFVGQPIVQNGNFEMGDFSYWRGSSAIETVISGSAHSGDYSVFIQAPDPNRAKYAYLAQLLSTFAGQPYLLSFWLSQNNDYYYKGDGTGDNEFIVSWNGDVLWSKFDSGATPPLNGYSSSWTNVQFIVQAADTSSFLQFAFHEGFDDWVLFDDVTVTPLSSLAPVLEIQPTGQRATLGTNVTIRAVAAGTPPLYYQWRRKGMNLNDDYRIRGSHDDSLTISGILADDFGDYRLTVSNAFGSVTSAVALLTLPPDCFSAWPGLVAWWRAEDNALDSANHNDGFLFAGTYDVGKIGRAFKFDGSQSRVLVPALDLSDKNAITIEAWVKPTAFERNANAAIVRQNSDWLFGFTINGSFLSFGLTTAGSYQQFSVPISPADYADGNWHHVAATYDGATKRIFRDGVEIGSAAQSGNLSFSAGNLLIGGGQQSDPNQAELFYGLIDEVAIYARALTPAEVSALFAADSVGKCIGKPAPLIDIQFAGAQIVLSWPTNSDAFHLQATSDLGSVFNWDDVTNTPSVSDASYRVLLDPGEVKQYFRLKSP